MGNAPIHAAGGVVFRETPCGREVLLVHRLRYDDWGLPKGKLKAGENLEQAALREVREETGYDVETGGYLGDLRYTVGGAPKTVHFWIMRPLGASHGIEDQSEVAEACWITQEAALNRLTHPLEREMLRRAMGNMVTECTVPFS